MLATSLVAASACGGDDDDDVADDGDDVDDGDDDGDVDAGIDAGGEMTRTGLLAVTETVLTSNIVKLPLISGAVVSMDYIDDQSVTVAPVPGFTSNVGGCAITVYDDAAGDEEPISVDEGGLVVSGTAHGEFACAFDDTLGRYVCQSTDPDLGGGVAGNAIEGILDTDGVLDVVGANFGPEMQGMQIQLDGFDGEGDGIYGVLEFIDAEALQLDAEPTADAVGGDDATYTTFVGEGPVLGGSDFLDDGTADVVVTKEDSTLVPGFEVTVGARGEGLILAGTQPEEFPDTDAEDLVFECVDADCGSEPEQAAGLLQVMVINGVTTDVLPDPLEDDGITMLPAVDAHATFSCSAIGLDVVDVAADGLTAILGTAPLRVQVTVGRFIASLEDEDLSSSAVVVGHSITGFTTFKK